MATLCEIYSIQPAARRAIAALSAAGVPDRDIRLLIGRRYHDVRSEPVGGFAGPVAPNVPVGRYAGPPRWRWQAAGSFYGEPDRQRQGSFADIDGNLIVSYQRGSEHSRPGGDLVTARLLSAANVTGEAAARIINQLREGKAVVLAEIAEIAPSDARARLEELAHAA